ncbi:MAG: phosphodiester glycosidase family protein [Deltaproteobacteria bacterium]|nr:phosphodiester glycosidase family protein [Deltaproteobacteria bacterium]
MRRGLFFLLILCLFPFTSTASDWMRLEPGLSYQKIAVDKKHSESVPYLIHVFKIDPRRYDFRPVLAAPERYEPIRRLAESEGAIIAVNANFFDPSGKPLGLIIKSGKEINPFKKISWWGVFYIEKGRPHIVHSADWKNTSGITTAVQAGPRLVVNGKVPRLKARKSQKTAVGINQKGEVILLTTLFPFEVGELAKLMARSEAKGGLGCVAALNFDGGSSSQMYARIGSFELRLPSYIGVPVGLGVFRK